MTISVRPELDPRIVRVPIADGTEIMMQTLVDQLRDWEDEPSNMSYPLLIKADGKTDLGGGIFTGITAILQNAQIEFEERITPVSTGTVTAGGGSSTLTDSGATFQADGVVRGAWVVNFTDQSVCTVRTVDSENQLTTTSLVEGSGNTFEISDNYKIWNIIQVEASGGNAVAIDDLGATISSVYTSFGTQVVRTEAVSSSIISSDTAAIADAVLASVIEGGLSLADVMRILLAADGGDVSGAATTEVTIIAADGSKTRIIATVDVDGNRTVTTLDGTI